MSTPVYSATPPKARHHKRTPTNELQEQMQHLIRLQYEQQKHIQGNNSSIAAATTAAAAPTTNQTAPPIPRASTTSATTSATTSSNQMTVEPPVAKEEIGVLKFDPEVGSGTLFMDMVRPKARRTASSDTSPLVSNNLNITAAAPVPATQGPTATNYGSLQQQQQQPVEQTGGMSSPEQHLEHEFYYGNPDFHDPYAPDMVLGGPVPPQRQRQQQQQQDSHRSLPARIGAFLWNPLQACVTDIVQSEALHRSLCFGAIDGMLTGSGIVATFEGLALLPIQNQGDDRNSVVYSMVVVLFCTAACFADSVCMALGHIWTAHVLASAQARERVQARRDLQHNRAEIKGQLVDMLLAKGMLKIDAMSLADTLEGYPDLFLAAVLGESLANANVRSQQQQREAPFPPNELDDPSLYQHDAYPSYGRLPESEMDPDAVAVREATSESRKESFFMMLGFSVFAIVPSLLFQWVPHMLTGSASVHPSSVILASMAVIMGLLGVWKSHFLDSNWLLFSVEAVMVLFLCMASAYSVGYGLKKVFLPEDVVLHVAFTHFDYGQY